MSENDAAVLTEAERERLRGLGQGQVPAVVERIIRDRMAPVWAILHAWEAWDGSLGPDGRIHPDASSPRDRTRLRDALTTHQPAPTTQADAEERA